MRRHFFDRERVLFFAARFAVAVIIRVARVVSHDEPTPQIGHAEISARGGITRTRRAVRIIERRAECLVQFRVVGDFELLTLAKFVTRRNRLARPHLDDTQRRGGEFPDCRVLRFDLLLQFPGRRHGGKVVPLVIFAPDTRFERPHRVCLRELVALCRNGDDLLMHVHTSGDRAALPVNDLTLRKVLCFQKDIARFAARAVLLRLTAQQNRLVPGEVAEYLQERDVGLQGVQRLAIDRKILVRLQKEPSYRLFHPLKCSLPKISLTPICTCQRSHATGRRPPCRIAKSGCSPKNQIR